MPWAKLQFSLLLLGVYANYCFKIFLSEWLMSQVSFSLLFSLQGTHWRRGETRIVLPSPVCMGVCTVPVGYFREASKRSAVYFYIITPFSFVGKKWWLRFLCSAVWSQEHWYTFIGSQFRTSLAFREQSTSGSAGAILVSLAKNILLVAVSTDAWCYYN